MGERTTLLNAVSSTTDGTAVDLTVEAVPHSLFVQLTGTWSATVLFEASVDGANYSTAALADVSQTDRGRMISTTTNGIWLLDDIGGLSNFRTRVSTYTSGNVTAKAGVI